MQSRLVRQALPIGVCREAVFFLQTFFMFHMGTGIWQGAVKNTRETLIKWYLENAQLFRLARHKLFCETGVDSSVLDCFKKSEVTQPNGINQRFPRYGVQACGN